jgi:hypothetical protein
MSRGHGELQKIVLNRLARTRRALTTLEVVDRVYGRYSKSARSSTLRALHRLGQEGRVHGMPGRPRKWILVRRTRPKDHRHGLRGQLDLFERNAQNAAKKNSPS